MDYHPCLTLPRMNIKRLILILLALPVAFIGDSCNSKKKKFNMISVKMGRQSVIEEYPKVPHDEILREIAGNRLYAELKERYVRSITDLKEATSADGVKLIVVIMTPEVGKSITVANTYGIPYIQVVCANLQLDCIDLSPALTDQEATAITQVPFDGHWSKAGAVFIADQLMPVINANTNYRSSKTFADAERPKVFGDLVPGDDEVLDGDKNMPYRLKVNDQGLRMGYNLTFPKKKQRILFLGDSQIFSPFLDNEYIATSILQTRFPDKEIINAGYISYTMDDFASLYQERARYAEPDVVVVCTNGGDILDFFFSHRNRFSRSEKSYRPSALEKKFYEQLYN